MEKLGKILLTAALIIVLVLGLYLISGAITKFTGYAVSDDNRFSDTDRCLEEHDITLFINSENPSEVLGNLNTIDYIDNIKIINCKRVNKECDERGFSFYPGWIIDDKVIAGDITEKELLDLSSCN